MTRLKQQARIMSLVGAEIDAYMRRPCNPAPADGLTPLQRINADPDLKARAAAEWDAMDAQGRLPADWPERRAALNAEWEGWL